MTVLQTVARAGNVRLLPAVASSWGRRLLGGTVEIWVAFPDQKSWWRNFSGDGHPLAIRLDGVDRTGHAVAHRGDDRTVSVTVRLDDADTVDR